MQLSIYLGFAGTCADAFKFYQSVLGGEIKMMMPYKGSPGEEMVPPHWRDKVMHAELRTDGMSLMGSDNPPDEYKQPQGYQISVNSSDLEECKRIFLDLSEHGTILMPFEKTFWAQGFGMLTDRFGINWVINCDEE